MVGKKYRYRYRGIIK